MPNYSHFVISQIFDEVWENWLNHEGEAAAQKAVTFFLKENKKEDLLKACEAYRLDNLASDPSFTYKLANFLNLDHWRDVLDANNLDKLRAKRDEAIEVINLWNSLARPHWIKVQSIETRIAITQKALSNKYFKEHWKEALEKATKIFAYPFREGDPREKLKLTFKWFVNCDHDKHTVLKVIEGEYGGPHQERTIKVIETKPIDYEARNKLAEEFKEMFPNLKFEPPKKEEKKEVEQIQISDEAKKLAEQIKSGLGKRPIIRRDKNNTEEITREVSDRIAEGHPEVSSEPDPFDFE